MEFSRGARACLTSSFLVALPKQDAMKFPIVGSVVLLSLFLAFKFLPKDIVNAILSGGCRRLIAGVVPGAVRRGVAGRARRYAAVRMGCCAACVFFSVCCPGKVEDVLFPTERALLAPAGCRCHPCACRVLPAFISSPTDTRTHTA